MKLVFLDAREYIESGFERYDGKFSLGNLVYVKGSGINFFLVVALQLILRFLGRTDASILF